jgi:hypothetical protein
MTEVSQNNFHSMSAVTKAVDKLKRLRARPDSPQTETDALTGADMDALIEHCDSTIGNVRLSDVPM